MVDFLVFSHCNFFHVWFLNFSLKLYRSHSSYNMQVIDLLYVGLDLFHDKLHVMLEL